MYDKITIALLLAAYILTSASILAAAPTNSSLPSTEDFSQPTLSTEEAAVTPVLGARQQIAHMFSEPVMIAIILGAIAVIVGVILSFAVCIRLLTRKSPISKPPPLEDTGEPLNSVEVVHTEE
ncbi:glycophorin-A [Cavia porcellus]|uniref:glycophorin-A n=1 Tax=Cavia porcellus TaxID=10141 RepID=UPI002FE3D8C3